MPYNTQSQYPCPPLRKLQIFSFDPAADISLETAGIGRCTIQIPWEQLQPGPVGEYVEVVDLDPSSDCAYDPVDLMDGHLLASDGFAPSTGNPQFHQQMVYAVVMKTIDNFEKVLGRHIQWSERLLDDELNYTTDLNKRYVGRLRIYPHALREQNAYYSPTKKALLFGYFNAITSDPREELPGGVVFTCLSHDIVAHETTHAIIDGLHRRLLDDTNLDMLAFHEAFADIVAIFQHFTLPGVLLDQIQRTRGDLRLDNMLVRLASQFARATARGGALRNALGERGPDGRQLAPDPAMLGRTRSPHDRGAILVAAVFDAFLKIYENRVTDLRRIATGGTGVLPQGDIHPDLAGRFAAEAACAAQHVLNICIRALDYLPPVDVSYGDFLRSLITADADFYPNDNRDYRLAFVESFRERGIYPSDIRTLSEESLRWFPMDEKTWKSIHEVLPPPRVLRTMAYAYDSEDMLASRLEKLNKDLDAKLHSQNEELSRAYMSSQFLSACWVAEEKKVRPHREVKASSARVRRYRLEREFAKFLYHWILGYAKEIAASSVQAKKPAQLKNISWWLGLDLEGALATPGGPRKSRLEVHAVRPTIRLRPDGRSKVELLVLLTQSDRKNLPAHAETTPAKRKRVPPVLNSKGDPLQYKFRGGCTLLIDPERGSVRYAISKNLQGPRRRNAHEEYLRGRIASLGEAAIERYRLRSETDNSGEARKNQLRLQVETFALTHRGESQDEEYG